MGRRGASRRQHMVTATAPRPDVVSGAVVAAADVAHRSGEQESAWTRSQASRLDLPEVTIRSPRGPVRRGDGCPSRTEGFMKLTTLLALGRAALAIGAALPNRSRLLAALIAVTLGLGLSGQMLAE